MKKFRTVNDVDTNGDEGKLLIVALGWLMMTEQFVKDTPEKIMRKLTRAAKATYPEK